MDSSRKRYKMVNLPVEQLRKSIKNLLKPEISSTPINSILDMFFENGCDNL